MFDWMIALQGLCVLLIMGLVTWLASLVKRDVSIVDSVWSLFFAAAALTYGFYAPPNGPRSAWVFSLVGLWAIRLCGYLTWRNWGLPEDRRYQEIRRSHEPGFTFKSLGIIFLFQALLAWVISLPILPALKSGTALGALDFLGIAVFLFGLGFETVADWQMARFKSRPENRGRVMDRGLWRYSRHPNYFGEFCLWWGFYLIALSAGSPIWIIVSPALISFLLLKVSGVPLLEKDIRTRRPGYRDYQARTSAFFPLPPKSGIDTGEAAL
jgi:steroid 5-alpha reductase family enzyme